MSAPAPDNPAAAPPLSLLALLALLWAGIYLPGLGGEELKGEEPRRALPGLEMIRSGDWLAPRVAGEAYDRKPPLINWLAAAGTLATGRIDEFSVRWPVAVLVLAMGLGTFAGVARAAGRKAGFLAAVFALTHIGLMEKGRLVEIDGAYTALAGLAFAAWFGWVGGGGPRRPRPWRGWLASGLFLGLAFLAKGPPHLLMFYAVLAGVWTTTRRWRDALHPAHFAGLAAAAAVAAPWFFLNARAAAANPPDGGAGPGATWLAQLTSRLDFSSFDTASWFSEMLLGVANFLPWSALLLPLLFRRVRAAAGIPEAAAGLLRGLGAGTVAGYFLIALTPAAHARFTMPLAVPAATFTALALCAAAPHAAIRMLWRAFTRGLAVAAAALAAAAAVWSAWHGVPGIVWLALPAALAVAALAWRAAGGRRLTRLAAASGLLMAAIAIAYAGFVQPWKAGRAKFKPTAAALAALMEPGEEAALYRAGLQPWVFYLWDRVREFRHRDDLPQPLPGPLVTRAPLPAAEAARLAKRYGEALASEPIANPWDRKSGELLVLRFPPPPAAAPIPDR
jgi:4-amino-4-deoxy-L-arabinose transferase-like glycosyltransferase